jgi:phosphoglycolate phosphatase-like HAD superfamily hydrolase
VTGVLVVFDIDGTLLRSADEHHRIITEVLARHGLDVLAKPWGEYKHYTDWAVIDEVVQDTCGRSVTADELAGFDREYLAAFEAHLATTEVAEIAGASRLLTALAARDDVHVGFATGSLRSMAVRKLALLGLEPRLLPTGTLATGGEYQTREEIVTAVISAVPGCDVVSLGDGAWDERTAVALGLPFVGVQSGSARFGAGAALVVADLTGLDADTLVALAAPPAAGVAAAPSATGVAGAAVAPAAAGRKSWP